MFCCLARCPNSSLETKLKGTYRFQFNIYTRVYWKIIKMNPYRPQMKLYTYIAPSRNPALRLAWKSIDPPKIIQIIEARFDYKYIFAETIIEKSCLEIGLEVVELLLHDLHLLKVVGNVLTTKLVKLIVPV